MNLVYKTNDIIHDFPIQMPLDIINKVLNIKTKKEQVSVLRNYIIEIFSDILNEDILNKIIEDIETNLSNEDTILDVI